MTESSVKRRKPGRPKVGPDNKRVSFTASIHPHANAFLENWADGARHLKKCRRMGFIMDEIVRHAARTNFNPNNK